MISQPSSDFIVRIRHADLRLYGNTVLRDLNWALRPGEHWGIVGRNGSGKTSFLHLISGQLWPAPGGGSRVYCFDGRRHDDAVEARQRITVVGPELQDRYARLGWNFSLLDVVLTGIFHSEIPRRASTAHERAAARRIIEELGLAELRDRPFLELSRGEQRRALIARAMAFGPQVLLLDEPATGLDRAARAALEATIERASRDVSIVTSAHQRDGLPSITTHLLELGDGVIAAQGPIAGDESTATGGPRAPLALNDRADRAAGDRAVVKIESADIWLGDRHVLKGISWTLAERQHWLVVGPNGAGKTTFLRLLHGQLRPARGGRIEWPLLGNPRNIWTLRGRIGWVSPELQADYRYPTSVFECVASGFKTSIGLTHRVTPEQQKRADELLAGFDLADLRDRALSSLSYGQFRRVLIARTLTTRPALILLDEPWEGLDPQSIEIVRRELHAAARRGAQLVCVSHIGDKGLRFTHEMELRDGKVIRAGPREYEAASPRESSTGERLPARSSQ